MQTLGSTLPVTTRSLGSQHNSDLALDGAYDGPKPRSAASMSVIAMLRQQSPTRDKTVTHRFLKSGDSRFVEMFQSFLSLEPF